MALQLNVAVSFAIWYAFILELSKKELFDISTTQANADKNDLRCGCYTADFLRLLAEAKYPLNVF